MITTLLIFSLVFNKITCDDVVSVEKDDIQKESADKHISNSDLETRRFIQDLDDDEWHVAHLKDTDFSRRSECVGDTLQDRVSKYRKALKHDAALVEFVSSEPIPFNATALQSQQDSCQNPNNYTVFLKNFEPKINADQNATKPGSKEKSKTDEKQESFKIGTIDEGVRTATTAKVKKSRKHNNVQNKTESRRASEYQFSSVEYYDEITQFDEDMCPDAIEVINLSIDQLRSYDVECEQNLEWRSLE